MKIGRVMCFVLGISAVTRQTKVVGTARRSELERTLGSFLFQSFRYTNEEPESQTEKGRNPSLRLRREGTPPGEAYLFKNQVS